MENNVIRALDLLTLVYTTLEKFTMHILFTLIIVLIVVGLAGASCAGLSEEYAVNSCIISCTGYAGYDFKSTGRNQSCICIQNENQCVQ